MFTQIHVYEYRLLFVIAKIKLEATQVFFKGCMIKQSIGIYTIKHYPAIIDMQKALR